MINISKKKYPINENITLSVEIAGEGEPLVFLHGAGGVVWDSFLESLSKRYKVIIPYLPGTGESTGLQDIDNLSDLVLTYYDLFDQLELDSVNVIGHSLGGMIALELAATDQNRVKNLVVACPVGLWLDDHPVPDIFAMLPDEVIEHAFADPQSPMVRMYKEQANKGDVNEKIEMEIERIKNLNAAGKFMWPIPDRGLKKRIHRVKCPTLIIWGKEDRIVPLVYGYEFHKYVANSKLEVIDNASHMVLMEQDKKVLDRVLNFLEMKEEVRN